MMLAMWFGGFCIGLALGIVLTNSLRHRADD